jgi:hypothetical protein
MSLCKFAFALVLISAVSMIRGGVVKGQEPNIKDLIRDLHQHHWEGPYPMASPLQWDFQLTEPMRKILEIGPAAQHDLLANINDPAIKDQIIILLGGVGDEHSISPIINAMIRKKSLSSTSNSERINLAANIALTNITVADVIWHYGGGVVAAEPPKDSKERWMKWWKSHRNFAVKTNTQSRNYSNYPNYGIYKQP